MKSPPTNGIGERVHQTILNEYYRVAFRQKLSAWLDELQAELDSWLPHDNEERLRSGRSCDGQTPMQAWCASKPLVEEQMPERPSQPVVVHCDDQPAVA